MAITLLGASATLYECRDEEVLLVGPAGSAKSVGGCKKLIDVCYQYPGSRHLLCRQTRKSMTDSIMVTFESVLGENHAETLRVNREQRHSYRIGRSEVVCAGLDEPAKAFGTGYGIVLLEEAIEATLNAWELFGRAARDPKLRREEQKPAFPYIQRIAVTNPGPVNHWLNKRATADPEFGRVHTRRQLARVHGYNCGPQTGKMRRLCAVHQDNPTFFDVDRWVWLSAGERYVASLSRMSAHRRKWMLDGLWSNAEGSVFAGAFSMEKNVIKSFRLPPSWPVWVYMDFGEDHPCAISYFTIAPASGRKILCGLIHGSNLGGVGPVARMIHEKNEAMGVRPLAYYGDPRHGWATTFQSTVTIAEQFAAHGIPDMRPWGRMQGKGYDAAVELIRSALASGHLLIFDDCQEAIDELQTWAYKRRADGTRPAGDDAYEEEGDDWIDTCRGFMASRHTISEGDNAGDDVGGSIADEVVLPGNRSMMTE